ncbi:hypothetical protein [Oryzihumus leptocrescens]|uniref:hypothetical protein n=1 Tax=Oryzihumus leptocrescens TaxID=297536 RepID=UPI001151AE08|nr:hypothetical protein [Oryzihumus leptocrescens]
MTSKRAANRLTRSGALGTSVWAPTVGFATLGMATVAAMTMVSLDHGAEQTPHAEAAGAKPTPAPQVIGTPADTPAAKEAQQAKPAKLHTRNVSLETKVADASSTLQARTASVRVTTAKVTKVVTKPVPKVNPAPAPAPKGGTTSPKSGGDGSGGSTGGASGAPAPAPAPQPVVGVNLPTGTGTSVDVGGLIHLGL